MTNFIGFSLLFASVGLVYFLVRREKRQAWRFLQKLSRRGFSRECATPAELAEKFPFLSARSGPRGALFLLGTKLGGTIQMAGGGSTRQADHFQGFVAPAGFALPDAAEPSRREALGAPKYIETLADGSQAYLWVRRHEPRLLEKTLAALQDVMEGSALGAEIPRAAPVPAALSDGVTAPAISSPKARERAPTPPDQVAPTRSPEPQLKRYFVAARFQAEGLRLRSSFSKCYLWPAVPERDQLHAILAVEARKIFAKMGYPDAKPTDFVMDEPPLELPEPPLPPADDPRPLKRWKVEASMVCHTIKFGAPIGGVFDWPEKPSAGVLSQIVYYLMSEAIMARGDHPGYAQESEATAVTLELVAERQL